MVAIEANTWSARYFLCWIWQDWAECRPCCCLSVSWVSERPSEVRASRLIFPNRCFACTVMIDRARSEDTIYLNCPQPTLPSRQDTNTSTLITCEWIEPSRRHFRTFRNSLLIHFWRHRGDTPGSRQMLFQVEVTNVLFWKSDSFKHFSFFIRQKIPLEKSSLEFPIWKH